MDFEKAKRILRRFLSSREDAPLRNTVLSKIVPNDERREALLKFTNVCLDEVIMETEIQKLRADRASNISVVTVPRQRKKRASDAAAKPKDHDSVTAFIKNCIPCVKSSKNAASDEPIASGHFGEVRSLQFAACAQLRAQGFVPQAGRRYAVKTQQLTVWLKKHIVTSWHNEVKMARLAFEIGVGPEVHAAFLCAYKAPDALEGPGGKGPQGVIVTDFIKGRTLESTISNAKSEAGRRALLDAAKEALAKLHAAGILHYDAHQANFMVADGKPKRVYLVDYGMSEHYKGIPARWDTADLVELGKGRTELLVADAACLLLPKRARAR